MPSSYRFFENGKQKSPIANLESGNNMSFLRINTTSILRKTFVSLPHAMVVTIFLSTVFGCAGLTTERDTVSDDLTRGFLFAHKSRGFRYYQTATYLLVHTDNNGGFVTKVLTLPDMNHRMSLKPYSFIASQELDFNFSNGTLGSVKANSDATALPKALIGAAQAAASAAAKAGLLDSKTTTEIKTQRRVPGPYLFKIVHKSDGPRLIGSGGKEILIPIPAAPKVLDIEGEEASAVSATSPQETSQ